MKNVFRKSPYECYEIRWDKEDITEEEKQEFLGDNENSTSNERFANLIEDFLCNGWSWIHPEEIGALTDAPIISEDATYNDDGELTECGICYAYMNYQVHDPVDELFEEGSIILESGEEE